MEEIALCMTCPHRDLGLCGALLRTASEDSDPQRASNWQRHRTAGAGQQVVAPNQPSDEILVLCGGWAFRFFQLSNGRRQILDFLLPGDLFSITTVFAQPFHFSIAALTEIQYRGFRRTKLQGVCAADPELVAAIGNICIVEAKKADELSTVLGQRSAEERVAHLFVNLVQRIAVRNVIRENRYPFPLRLQHVADAVGLTPVHVSRVMSMFRNRSIVHLSNGILEVSGLAELTRLGSLC